MQTLLLLLTIVALGVTLWRTGHEVMPLREQARNYRRELGHFSVSDPTKIHVQGAQGVYSKVWKWQLFLPPGRLYKVCIYEGKVPEVTPQMKQTWLDGVRTQARGFQGPLIDGQFSLDVSVEEYDGKWWCRYGYLNEIKTTYELRPQDGWLKDVLKFTPHSDAGHQIVRTFDPGEPIILLHMRRGTIRKLKDDWEVEEPIGPADSLVIWIE